MSNEITPGKRVLFRLRLDDKQLTPGVVTSVDGIRVMVLANGEEHETSLLSQVSGDLKLATQDDDPAAWMLHDGKTSKHAPGVQEVGLLHSCYVCADPEFAQMGLPLCRPCPECQRNQQDCQACGGTGGLPDHTPCTDCLSTGKLGLPGHIPADDSVCDCCGHEETPADYPQAPPVPPFRAVVYADVTIPDQEMRPGEDTVITVPEDCAVHGVQIWDSADPARPIYWIMVGKTLRLGDKLHVPGTFSVSAD